MPCGARFQPADCPCLLRSWPPCWWFGAKGSRPKPVRSTPPLAPDRSLLFLFLSLPPTSHQARAFTQSCRCCTPSRSLAAAWCPHLCQPASTPRPPPHGVPIPRAKGAPLLLLCLSMRAAAWLIFWRLRRGSGGGRRRAMRDHQCCCSTACARGQRGSWKVRVAACVWQGASTNLCEVAS